MVNNHQSVSKNIFWYLFLLANVLIVLGCAITWLMCKKQTVNVSHLYLPTLICNFLALALGCAFAYFDLSNILLKSMHFKHKWLIIYYLSMLIFTLTIVTSFLFYLFLQKNYIDWKNTSFLTTFFIIYFVTIAITTLVAIGLQRYSYFKIQLDILKKTGSEKNK